VQGFIRERLSPLREATVDLSAAAAIYGRGWSMAKIAAFVCFGVACGLMVAALIFAPDAHAVGGQGKTLFAQFSPSK
jgi:hypothetical protein